VKDERSANAYDKAAVCARPTLNYYSTQMLRLPSRTSVANRPLLPRKGVNKMERLCPLLDQSGRARTRWPHTDCCQSSQTALRQYCCFAVGELISYGRVRLQRIGSAPQLDIVTFTRVLRENARRRHVRRHLISRRILRQFRTEAMNRWKAVTAAA